MEVRPLSHKNLDAATVAARRAYAIASEEDAARYGEHMLRQGRLDHQAGRNTYEARHYRSTIGATPKPGALHPSVAAAMLTLQRLRATTSTPRRQGPLRGGMDLDVARAQLFLLQERAR